MTGDADRESVVGVRPLGRLDPAQISCLLELQPTDTDCRSPEGFLNR
jgi:hypothetical protein